MLRTISSYEWRMHVNTDNNITTTIVVLIQTNQIKIKFGWLLSVWISHRQTYFSCCLLIATWNKGAVDQFHYTKYTLSGKHYTSKPQRSTDFQEF